MTVYRSNDCISLKSQRDRTLRNAVINERLSYKNEQKVAKKTQALKLRCAKSIGIRDVLMPKLEKSMTWNKPTAFNNNELRRAAKWIKYDNSTTV